MNSKKNDITAFSENQSLFSQSSQSQGPTPKKPKLDIAINGIIPKEVGLNHVNNNNKDDNWGPIEDGEIDIFEEACSQAEMTFYSKWDQNKMTQNVTPAVRMAQLTKSNVNPAVQINEKFGTTAIVDIRNGPRVPLRRTGSSQWPSSSTFASSHPNNAVVIGKGPADNANLLHDALEKLTLENEKIKEELYKKCGEAKILRDKVNNSEMEKEKIKREFTGKMDTIKVEAERTSSNLEKEIRSLKGQLDVKNMELKTAEGKVKISSSVQRIQPDSPIRLGGASSRSFQNDSSLEGELNRTLVKEAQVLPLKFIRDLVIPKLLEPSQPEAPVTESTRTSHPRLFSGVLGTEGGSVGKREMVAPLSTVSPCAAMLLAPGLVDITSDFARQTISRVVDVCHKILTELLKQLESASCPNNRLMEREKELFMSGCRQLPLDREYDLIGHRELYRDERGVQARRALGLMCSLVQATDVAAEKILSSSPKDTTELLDTVRSIVRQVEKQRRTLLFQGVLAGSVALIKDLFNRSETPISSENQTLIVDILRWVVLSRPGSLVIRNILQTLVAALRYPSVVGALCHSSAEKTYKENLRHSIIQFTPDSCILQVLCSLVKTAETPRKHQLTDLLTQWVLSLFCGGGARPQWLTSVPSAMSCQCHSLLCKLCFSLLSEECFTYSTVRGHDRKLVERLLARGVLLVNAFMNEDVHLLAIVDPHSLGCYEHFLHFMGEAKFTLDPINRDILEFLCKQEEALKQLDYVADDRQTPSNLQASLNLLIRGDQGINCPNVLDILDSL